MEEIEEDMEIWKDIAGFEGLYQVSNKGRIKGLPRYVNNHTGRILLKERFLYGSHIQKGYVQVRLSANKTRVMYLIHVLVAKAFIPNPNNYPQVNHINGKKDDNRVENLEWCTNSMNQLHAYRMGLNKRSDKSGKPKRPVKIIDKEGRILYFDSISALRNFFGLKRSTNINKVLSPKYKSHKTIKNYKIEYA